MQVQFRLFQRPAKVTHNSITSCFIRAAYYALCNVPLAEAVGVF